VRLSKGKLLAKVAQLVEHAAENRGVGSSILPLGTNSASISFDELAFLLGE
jgi:hypothetical protein